VSLLRGFKFKGYANRTAYAVGYFMQPLWGCFASRLSWGLVPVFAFLKWQAGFAKASLNLNRSWAKS